MGMIDINNPPSAPDSDLNSDLSEAHDLTIQDASLQSIAPGDWVDVDPSCLSADPNWGYSFQVMAVHPNDNVGLQAVDILISQDNGQSYFSVNLSASWIQNNFRRVPRTE